MTPAALRKYRNPFAVGQYINHPPKGNLPNVMSFTYDFPIDVYGLPLPLSVFSSPPRPEEYKAFIPNTYGVPESPYLSLPEVYMRSLLLITKRRIEDEELFLNYRYNPNNPYPSWYTPVPDTEAKRRWAPRSWLD